MVLIIKTDSRKIQVFQQYGLKDDMIKNYETLSQTPGCLVGVFIIVFKKSSLLHIWNQNWSGREVQNNHLEGWVVNNIYVLSWNLHINPSQI